MNPGIVGSDPYLAPEVYNVKKYDAQAVDIWSLAIIFCCMCLKRFPWKIPRVTDLSFKYFASEPTPGHDPKKLTIPSRSTTDLSNTPARDFLPIDDDKDAKNPHGGSIGNGNADAPADHHKSTQPGSSGAAGIGNGKADAPADHHKSTQPGSSGAAGATGKKEIIRGPWRILRLLPRESRHIIGQMLEIDPKKRACMDDIVNDPWVADTVICQQASPGVVYLAEDHTHTLEPSKAQD
jgi:serine/threonine protein kinase